MTSTFSLSTAHDDIEDAAALARRRVNLVSRNLAETEAARSHWLERVKGAKDFGSTERSLALRLARADTRVPGGLEIIGSGADWGRDCGFKSGEPINQVIPKFETQGLVKVVVRGWGLRNWHLILLLSPQHWQEVGSLAKSLLDRELENARQTGI